MKQIIRTMWILSCFVSLSLHAASKASTGKNTDLAAFSQILSKKSSKMKKKNHHVKKAFCDESFQVTFFREPLEMSFTLPDTLRESIISELLAWNNDDDDDDDHWMLDDDDEEENSFPEEFFSTSNIRALFPKAFLQYLAFNGPFGSCQGLSISKLQQSQAQVVEVISALMANYEHCCQLADGKDEIEDEDLFSCTPMKKNQEGNYVAELFYCLIDDRYDDEENEANIWAKIIVTNKNLYCLFFISPKSNGKGQKQASTFFSSLQVNTFG